MEKVEERMKGVEKSVEGVVEKVDEQVVSVEKNMVEVAEGQEDRVRLLEERVIGAIGDEMKVLGERMGLLRKEIMEKVEELEKGKLVEMKIKVVLAGPSNFSGYKRR
ncbi:hypothetical protein L873DRAFT_1791301 [Choiromyces venosus 120613-1]|uniref:Uncharacterized protein n=1 Tax=Choiromyces venosus 120613-1 TaxID=1336337 RepID=A0A3N4JFH3_9PEZI|nr:hypothetical protein L873DRAFT_1791301 [Choiromyces venosus 120613-1]